MEEGRLREKERLRRKEEAAEIRAKMEAAEAKAREEQEAAERERERRRRRWRRRLGVVAVVFGLFKPQKRERQFVASQDLASVPQGHESYEQPERRATRSVGGKDHEALKLSATGINNIDKAAAAAAAAAKTNKGRVAALTDETATATTRAATAAAAAAAFIAEEEGAAAAADADAQGSSSSSSSEIVALHVYAETPEGRLAPCRIPAALMPGWARRAAEGRKEELEALGDGWETLPRAGEWLVSTAASAEEARRARRSARRDAEDMMEARAGELERFLRGAEKVN